MLAAYKLDIGLADRTKIYVLYVWYGASINSSYIEVMEGTSSKSKQPQTVF